MKKILFLLLLFSSILAKAQYTYQIVARNLTAPNSTTSANIIGSGAAFHNLTWNVSGTVSGCSVRIDSSTDGITWGTGDIIGATTCTSNGNTISTSHVVNYVRINLVTLTGAGATFTANISGYITQPTAGGTVTSVTCGTGLSGGTITSTGTCALANTAVTPASYTNTNITVDQQGRITAASNGTNTSAIVQLETHTASTSATLDFTTCISGTTYHEYQFRLRNLIPDTGSTTVIMQVSTDGGSTYKAGASDYTWQKFNSNTGASSTSGSTGDTSMTLTNATNPTTVANGGTSGWVNVYDPLNGAHDTHFLADLEYFDTTPNMFRFNVSSVYKSTTAVNAIRFKPNSGNFATGVITCYGITP